MKRTDWQNALKVDFSRNRALKATLLEDLLRRPDAPIDEKEDMPMKATIKYSSRALIAALITVLLLSGIALAAMKTFSLGPFATYTQQDDTALRQEIDAYVNQDRSVWEGKLFDADGNPVEDLAQYLWEVSKGEHPYELYNANGELSGLAMDDGRQGLVTVDGTPDKSDALSWMDFRTLEEAKPYLNSAFNPILPTALPDGYALDRFSIFTDDDGKPYPATEYLMITCKKQDKEFMIYLRLMNEDTAFESTTPATLTKLIINGYSAISDGTTLSMLIGDVLYEFYPHDSGLAMDELIKMAQSIG